MTVELPPSPATLLPMEKGTMRIVGSVRQSWTERFNRVQSRAALFRPAVARPKGVQRFRTWEEMEQATRPWLRK